jgi:hypothetical protein
MVTLLADMIKCSKCKDHESASMDDHKEHLGEQGHNISLSAELIDYFPNQDGRMTNIETVERLT